MKLSDILKVISQELGTSDLKEINNLLKKEPAIKFRITGKALGHFGFTGHIKSFSEEGVKAIMANKVSLIRLAEIETFEKAKPREERPVRTAPKTEKTTTPATAPTKAAVSKKPKTVAKPAHQDLEDDTDFDDDFDDEELRPKKMKKGKPKPAGKSGSKFIPTSKK